MIQTFAIAVKNLPPITADFAGDTLISLKLNQKTTNSVDIPPHVRKLERQLAEYAARKRKIFEIDFELRGTEFQKAVWRKLLEVKYGETVSYSGLAAAVGGAQKARAVGGAVNKNPIAIIVPCHRVVGKNGGLTGFACGLEIKKRLLSIEGISIQRGNKILPPAHFGKK